MTCPYDGQWFDSKDNTELGHGLTYTFEYDNKKGRYHCIYGETRYNFYVQGKGE